MYKVLGCWELGYNSPLNEFYLWNFPLRDYSVDEFIMTPVSGIDKKVVEYKDIPTAIEANKELEVIYIDEKGEEDLESFVHPEDCLYVLGKAGYSPMRAIGNARSIKIETIAKGGMLWPHQCITIVLRDRMLKDGHNNNR